jgi:hypothetical protein
MYRLADGLRTDDPARAQEICGQAVDLYRRHVDWPMDDSMSAFGLMAELCRDRGERAVASSLVNEALRHGRTATSGADHRAVANMLVHQGALLLKADDPGAAEPLLRECLAIRVSVLPPGDWLIADTKSMLGEALSRLGRFDEAEPLLLAGFNVIKAKPRAPAKAKRAALDRLIRHFEACGKSDQASEFRALASAGTHAEKND